MKQLKSISILCLVALLMLLTQSCSKDDYLRYDTQQASLRFFYEEARIDSISYSFALHPGVNEDELEIPVKLIGIPIQTDRQFAVEMVASESSSGATANFEISECILRANSINGMMKVRVKKTDNLETETIHVKFRLCGDDNFMAGPINQGTFIIELTGQLIKPTVWPFGEYSRIKHEFVISVTGVGDYASWGNADRIYWTSQLAQALYEYNKAHPGNPLRDESGMLITF